MINEYSAEYHAQIWDYATFELNEKIYNNLVEFDVDVRYAVDLMSMSMDFQFAVPFKADRDDITKSLTNYTAGFDKSLFNIIAAETDRDTGAPINDEGGANKSLAGDRVYVIRPINLVDRLEFYLNGSFVGQIPHKNTDEFCRAFVDIFNFIWDWTITKESPNKQYFAFIRSKMGGIFVLEQ